MRKTRLRLKDRWVCIELMRKEAASNSCKDSLDDVGVSFPNELTPDLIEIVFFIIGVPKDTHIQGTQQGLCLDYLYDKWFDLVGDDPDTAAVLFVDFLDHETAQLHALGHPPRTEI